MSHCGFSLYFFMVVDAEPFVNLYFYHSILYIIYGVRSFVFYLEVAKGKGG